MEIWLTYHMFGEKLQKIASGCKTFNDAMWEISKWKKSAEKTDYKIEPYDRIIHGKEQGTAVDFGDYSYFMLILKESDDEKISSFK